MKKAEILKRLASATLLPTEAARKAAEEIQRQLYLDPLENKEENAREIAATITRHLTQGIAEWEPISTAPDATYVLVFLPAYGVNVAIQTKHPQGDHWWMRDHNEYCYPTHWMPLPDPPG